MGAREEQRFLASVRAMACAGGMDTLAQELVSLYFKEFMLQLRVEKGVLFRIAENGKMEYLARYGVGDSVTSLLVTDVHEKLPDLRFYQAAAYRAQELLLARTYLLMGDVRTRVVFVAYNILFYSKPCRLMRHKESRWYYEVFMSYLVRALKQASLEREVGCGELSGLKGYKAFCAEYRVNTYDAVVLFRVSDMTLLYESLAPREFADFIVTFSEKVTGAVRTGEQVYHFGDSHFVLCLNGGKWDICQRVKLLLTVLNDLLCSKRPLSCPDIDVRAGLMYIGEDRVEQLLSRLFGCVKRAGNGSIYIYGQLAGEEESETVLLDAYAAEPHPDCVLVPELQQEAVELQDSKSETVVASDGESESMEEPVAQDKIPDKPNQLDAVQISSLLGINY